MILWTTGVQVPRRD